MRPYVNLHSHTTGSIGDSIISPRELIEATKEVGQTAVAVTDHGSCSALWDAYKATKKTDVKLIAGCETYFVADSNDDEDTTLRHLILLAKNAVGYKNLLTLNKRGFDKFTVAFKRAIPRIDWKMLEEFRDGLICTSACGSGVIAQHIMADQLGLAKTAALRFQAIFGDDFALELQPHNLQRRQSPYSGAINQQKINMALKRIGYELGIRCIVATDSHYLKKEDHEDHDAYICIASGQPKTSGSRLIYDKHEFYVKNSDQIFENFSRHMPLWGEEFVESLFTNTIYYSDKCENPDWIDPAVSTGEKSQLPDFPYKDEPDLAEFEAWKSTGKLTNPNIGEDAQFYRYRSEIGLEKKIHDGKIPEADREEGYAAMREEFDVLEYRNFSSYMLIVSSFIDWGRLNGVFSGPGRGCTSENTLILTKQGYKKIIDIKSGELVATHLGKYKPVIVHFNNGLSNDVLEIKTQWSFYNQYFTKDHKLLATHNIGEMHNWILAEDLKDGDYLFHPWVKREISDPKPINMLDFIGEDFEDNGDYILISDTKKQHKFSIRQVSRDTGIHYRYVNNYKHGISSKYDASIKEYIEGSGLSLNEWRDIEFNIRIKKTIEWDSDFCYLLGRWVGDGCFHGKTRGITIAFNRLDVSGINKTKTILEKLFGTVYINHNHGGSGCVSLTVSRSFVAKIFSTLFPNYINCETKHFPLCFRNLSDSLLKSLLFGYVDSDGCRYGKSSCKFKTVSRRLALETREALLYLKIPSGCHLEKRPIRNGVYNKPAYSTFCSGFVGNRKNSPKTIIDDGFYCKIISSKFINPIKTYDIKVKDDASYLSSGYAVHNSVGGSLTAYVNGIHQAYPKRYGLIFARFLNKYKEAFPDIDVDFAPSGREKLYNYLCGKYGTENVCHVSNINTITPKVYARDIARVFEFGGLGRTAAVEIGNNIADSLPAEMHTIKQALEEAPLFAEYAKQYPELTKYASLCGKPRAWSTHAGGIIISKRPLTGLVPLRRDTAGALVLEYDKEKAEENGLVKIDILGLETLDIIGETYHLIQESGKIIHNLFDYELSDEKSYQLVSEGDTFGVFQLASTAVPVCKKVKPKDVGELALITALVRPAAKDIIPGLLKVRNGDEKMSLLHPSLYRGFANTYGFGLFEESLMYLAQDVAGWDLHDADKLRKLTKEKGKNPEKVKKWRQEFIDGAVKNRKISEEIATKIWDETISQFSGYGFNKSHATLYSMISFHTAYLKANYPIEFMVANLMSEVSSNAKSSKDNILKIKAEIRNHKVKIVPPDVNTSELSWKIVDDKTLMTGLDSLKYMGKDAIPELIAKRPFTSFQDLVYRTDATKVRSPSIQAMAASGSLDSFGMDRKLMFYYASDYRAKLRSHMAKLDKIWAKAGNENVPVSPERVQQQLADFKYPFPAVTPWSVQELYALEEFYMGEGISGDTFDRYPKFFDRNKTVPFSALQQMFPWERQFEDDERANRKANTHYLGNHKIRPLEAVVTSLFVFIVKKEDSKIFGKEMARLTIQDPWGDESALLCFPEAWEAMVERIKDLSGGKQKVEAGIAIRFLAQFQWENEHSTSFILGDILDFKEPPSLPEDRASKKVKMPRSKKATKEELLQMTKDDLLDKLEDEMLEEGFSTVDDEDEDLI